MHSSQNQRLQYKLYPPSTVQKQVLLGLSKRAGWRVSRIKVNIALDEWISSPR